MAETDAATAADESNSGDIVAKLKARIDRSCVAAVVDGGLGSDDRRLHRPACVRTAAPIVLAPRRVFVQARQIYCFAKAAQIGWYPQGREIALKGLEHLLARAKSPDGKPGFVHTLAPDGAVLDPLRDTYDHAFVLLALATRLCARSRCAGSRRDRRAVRFLDTQLRSPHGGFLEGLPASMPRRQNPQMHLFEAMIAAFDATHEPVFQNRAGDFFALFLANLYDKQKQVLGEYFEDDWSRIEPVSVEPGHQAEWVWLLKGFERITGCPTGRFRSRIAGVGAALSRRGHRLPDRRGRRRGRDQAAHAGAVAADRNRQGVDRAGRGGRSGRRRRSARGAGAAGTALSQPSRRGRLVRSVRPRRQLAGRDHSGVVVLSCALRRRGSGSGAGVASRHAGRVRSAAARSLHSHRFRRLKLFRFLKLLRWSPAPPR